MAVTAFVINGRKASVDVAPDTPLLWIVREHLKLTGTKFGCGSGLCGACTVHLDGKAVRSCQVTASQDGAIQQSNFNDYPVLRMSDLPEIHTRIVTSNNPPTGMGEIGVVAVAPAIANALFQLTGKRIRALPMSPERVKQALA